MSVPVSQKLKLFTSTLINHFEITLITYSLNVRNVLSVPGAQKSFSAGYSTLSMPMYALQDAASRLICVAELFYPVKKAPKNKHVQCTEAASDWIADLHRYNNNTNSSSAKMIRVLVHVALDLFQSFEQFFERDDETECIEECAINVAEMIIKYFASPIHGKNAIFDAHTILQGILICSGCGHNSNQLNESSKLPLDEQSIVECCYGKLFSTLFKIDRDNRKKSLFAQNLCDSAILHDNKMYDMKSRPRAKVIRRPLVLVEQNSDKNLKTLLDNFNLQIPIGDTNNCSKYIYKIETSDVVEMNAAGAEHSLLNKLYQEIQETNASGTFTNSATLLDKVEGAKAKILNDIKGINALFNLNVMEELIGSLESLKMSVNFTEDEDEDDADSHRDGKSGAGTKITTVKYNKMQYWKSTFN